MGISNFAWHLIKNIENSGGSLGDVLTIGVQRDYRIFKNNDNYSGTITKKIQSLHTSNKVDTLDISDYQGANIISNLSEPLDKKIQKYNTVVDVGTIEHVFNVKQCIYNYISLVSEGGNLMIETPCNNFAGHGFYQFSSEFFYNIFNFNSLFKEFKCYLVKYPIIGSSAHPKAWISPDPKLLGRRLTIKSADPIGIIAIGKRSEVPLCPFEKFDIIQSDYVTEYKKVNQSKITKKATFKRKLFNKLPFFLKHLYANFNLNLISNINNKSIFKPYKWQIETD